MPNRSDIEAVRHALVGGFIRRFKGCSDVLSYNMLSRLMSRRCYRGPSSVTFAERITFVLAHPKGWTEAEREFLLALIAMETL